MAVTVERGRRDRSPGLVGRGGGLWGDGLGGREPDISASSIFGFRLLVGAISVTLPNETPVRVSLSFFFKLFLLLLWVFSLAHSHQRNTVKTRETKEKKPSLIDYTETNMRSNSLFFATNYNPQINCAGNKTNHILPLTDWAFLDYTQIKISD